MRRGEVVGWRSFYSSEPLPRESRAGLDALKPEPLACYY